MLPMRRPRSYDEKANALIGIRAVSPKTTLPVKQAWLTVHEIDVKPTREGCVPCFQGSADQNLLATTPKQEIYEPRVLRLVPCRKQHLQSVPVAEKGAYRVFRDLPT